MCGIIGIINVENHRELAEESLNKIIYRGIDNKDLHSEEKFTFAHCLHSVVGNKPQPIIKDDFIFGTNCEIYNWKDLSKKHNLNSENDADLLLDLLIKNLKGKKIEQINNNLINKTLSEINGVFAFFIHNKKENYTILARDIVGEKPLWFHKNNSLIFASEKKAIVSNNIEPEELNPRKVIIFNHKNNELKFLDQDFFKITHNSKFDIKTTITGLCKLVEQSVIRRVPEKNLGILFSGGLDSTLLAFILKKNNIPFTAYMTVSETKSTEIEKAESIAQELGFDLNLVKIDKKHAK